MTRCRSFAFLAVAAFAPLTASAQTGFGTVFVTSVGNKIVEVDLDTGTIARTVVTAPGSNFQGLVVRKDLFLVVADHNGGGRIKICSSTSGQCKTITSAIAFPSGVTLDGNANLFVVNGHAGHKDRVWKVLRDDACLAGANPLGCTNGGYQAAQAVDAEVRVAGVPTTQLSDAKFVNGVLYVVVEKPGYLLGYADPANCTGSCDPTVVIDTINFNGQTPKSVALTETHFFIATAEGKILTFPRSGPNVPGTEFASLSGKGERVAVGLQGGNPFLFVTFHKTVRRYDFSGGTPMSVGGLNSTVGVSLASAGAVPFSTGLQTGVFETLNSKFNVEDKGFADISCISFTDIREGESGASGIGPDQPLHRDLPLNDPNLPSYVRAFAPPPNAPGGFPNRIPRYVRAFKSGASEDGPATFRLCLAAKSTGFDVAGVVELKSQEEGPWLGNEPLCNDPSPAQRPRLFYSEEPNHDPIQEGRVFVNQSTLCNRDGGDAWDFGSIYLTGGRDARPLDGPACVGSSGNCAAANAAGTFEGIIDCQLFHLRAVLASASCIAERMSLLATLDTAIGQFEDCNYDGATSTLTTLQTNLGSATYTGCPETLKPELQARTRAILFELGQSPTCPGTCSNVPPSSQP